MSNIVERLRADAESTDDIGLCAEAADRIVELERELAAETNNKQEFERDWLACCDKLNDERRIHLELEETLVKKLESAQARENVLMVAIESLVENVDRPPDANCSCCISPPCSDCVDYGGLREAFEWVDTALAMPTDDTTLNNLLAEGQSREKVLRDALDYLAHNLGEYACAMQTQQQADVLTNYSIVAFAALAQPSDDTALKAAIQHGITEFLERTGKYVTNDASRKAALKAERERCRLHDAADVATKAMRKAWQLGQTYWQQADSESYRQNAKSAITQDAFNDLLDSTAEEIRALGDEK